MGKETASEEAPVRAPEKPKPVKKVLDKNNHMMRGILDIQKDREGVKRNTATQHKGATARPRDATNTGASEDELANARAEARATKLRMEEDAKARKVWRP